AHVANQRSLARLWSPQCLTYVVAHARGAGFCPLPMARVPASRDTPNAPESRTHRRVRNKADRCASRLHLGEREHVLRPRTSGPEPDVQRVAPLDPRAVRAIAARAELRTPLERSRHGTYGPEYHDVPCKC